MRFFIFSSIFLGLFFMTNAFENLNFEKEFGLNDVKSFGDRLKRQNLNGYKFKKLEKDEVIDWWKFMVSIHLKKLIQMNFIHQ